ncbi:zinc finger protein 77 [Danaus plexippus plexippus]|uniref:Zinc finger protein 77 n=1 Tax=Danaus plexippus plexippus TaxID=278856 RepID=A0A212FM90_DANPL|nr:zinc finger protein 879-like [Danaus plexippus plexippus]OWR54799.1 zinc finger protein 77 [Danaus plexippus plexippus]
MDDIMVESLPILGTCSLCLAEGIVRSMILKENNETNRENYIDILLKCFSIDMLSLDLDDTKYMICSLCIKQLEICHRFKEQVIVSLRTLEASTRIKKADQSYDVVKIEGTENNVNCVKEEMNPAVRLTSCSDVEDSVLNDLLIKHDPDELRSRRSRRNTLLAKKKVSYSVRKQAELKETERMLKRGLFPFKIGKNQTYTCAICPEKSTALDDIKSHITDHNIANIHVAFKKTMTSNQHRFYKYSTKLKCKLCKEDIRDYVTLKNHIGSCVRSSAKCNNLPFKLEKDQLDCPICKKTFLNFVSLNTHMNVHYPNHVCDNCGKAFASKARLRGHMRTHEIGDFPCRYCDQVFDRVTKRENHVSKEHKSGIRYACKRCNISLTSFYARQKHLAEVHNEELKRYKCKACTQSYITPGHLSSHVRRDHLNERNHKCTKCDQAFYTRNSLKMHMIKHDGERIHTCNICNKSYQRKKTLREHMRIHNNDKRFVCPVCARAFTQKCTLKGHLKVHERRLEDNVHPSAQML